MPMVSRTLCATFAIAALLMFGLAASGCGGGSNSGQNAANTPATAAGQAMNAMSAQAPIPAGLQCKTRIVWVNLSTRVYHEQGDPWYGRTHNGEYMCLAEANLKGYHLAGSGAGGSMGSGMSAQGSPHHHHHMPSPSST
jgi:hypothetical protein